MIHLLETWTPHGHCYNWTPDVLWLSVIGDFIIFAAYMLIPVALFAAIKRIAIAYQPLRIALALFGTFIFFCGITHLFDIITVWYPIYRLVAWERILTGAASLATWIYIMRSKLRNTTLLEYELPDGRKAVDIVLPLKNKKNT